MGVIEVREIDAVRVLGSASSRQVRVRLWPDGTLAQLVIESDAGKFDVPAIAVHDERGVVSRQVEGDQTPIVELPDTLNRLTITLWCREIEVINEADERSLR